MVVIDGIENDILDDFYFSELRLKAELYAAFKFFNSSEHQLELNKKEFLDLLKYSDILSYSKSPRTRNLSYRIVSLLSEQESHTEIYKIFSTAILSKLGNFPALSLLSAKNLLSKQLPIDREIEKINKELIQRVPNSDKTFTDSQYEVFRSLIENNHFSFSGPTSLGKSFIFKHFISYLIDQDSSCGNIVILVPTRALITQVSNELKKDYERHSQYAVVSYPTLSPIIRKTKEKFIFVFTPERLLSYLSDSSNPKVDYLFIDEAHKMLIGTDTRSPLYYHAIVQAKRKSVRLFFASPNVPNPEIFLEIFEISADEKLNIQESPVTQNLYYVDLVEKKTLMIYEKEEITIENTLDKNGLNSLLLSLGKSQKNIIYCNTVNDTIQDALDFSKNLPDIAEDGDINSLIKLIKEQLHKDYYLINCLKKGVAFHFGKLPQNIRERVEKLFAEGKIDYIFCTSTLLEGVNLPAKNIFILSNAISTTKFTDIDFWNLAGRAGRLTKELSGNIICVRAENKKNRWDKESDRRLLREKTISKKISPIDKTKRSIFENMSLSIQGSDSFTKATPTSNEIETWNHYANIVLIHEKLGEESVLKSNFISRNLENKKLLTKTSNEIQVPKEILIKSSAIKLSYQNRIYTEVQIEPLPSTINSDIIYSFLLKFYKYYNWEREETTGNNPMIHKDESSLRYYAMLMDKWMNSKSLSQIIWESIQWYSRDQRMIWNSRVREKELFGTKMSEHINILINDIINDIENILRFKMERYFQNYYELASVKLGESNAGSNWAEFLEYGTTDKKIIDLQNYGFPRHLAKHIVDNYAENIVFENNELVSIDLSQIRISSSSKDSSLDNELYNYCLE